MSTFLLFLIWMQGESRNGMREADNPFGFALFTFLVIWLAGPVLLFYGVKDAVRTSVSTALAATAMAVLLCLLVASWTSWWWYPILHLGMGILGLLGVMWRAWQRECTGEVPAEESPESGPGWRFS
jgi:hypothetical protein